MERLQRLNCSMGLMLEILSDRLDAGVHRHAPGKRGPLRVQQLEWAGQLGIPFTTGLLLGIGETEAERLHTLETIAEMHRRWGHIQEVILQPHSPGGQQPWPGGGFAEEALLAVTRQARRVLPDSVALQIPPNLVRDPVPFLEAGARDLGGIGPKDVVNPDYTHPQPLALAGHLAERGWLLHPRLPVYAHLYNRVPQAVQPVLATHTQRLCPGSTGA
jgi:FO synthase subunit 1